MGIDRKGLISLIHIAKQYARECPECKAVSYSVVCKRCRSDTVPLSDDRYREILSSYGNASCRFLSDDGLKKVYQTFIKAGFKPRVNHERRKKWSRKGTMAVIGSRAYQCFGPDWEPRVQGFVVKCIGKQDLQSCDDNELRKVAGWLYRYMRYQKEYEDGFIEEN